MTTFLLYIAVTGGLLWLWSRFIQRISRAAALVLAIFCLLTAAMVHYHPADRMQMINFWKNLTMAGGFLQIVAWGAGRWSVDRR